MTRLTQELKQQDARIKENQEKIKLNTKLPHLVANIGEILEVEREDEETGTGLSIKGKPEEGKT